MENINPIVKMDQETSPRMAKSLPMSLDTHAMAYKLLLSGDRQEEEETCNEQVSDHGKEARMEFYQNRSRSDGASAIMKSALREMRQRKLEESLEDDDEDEEEMTMHERTRRKSSSSSFESIRRKMSEPSKLSQMAKDIEPEFEPEPELEEPRLEMPKRAPLTFIPTVDSSSDLFNYGEQTTNRKKLFSENRFVPYFSLPSPAFLLHCLLDERKICLESIDSSLTNHILRGTILIKRSPQSACDDHRRRVYARRTLDGWKSHQDIDAQFLEACKQRQNADRFTFQMGFTGGELKIGSRLEFALAYEIHCIDDRMVSYWDNNNNANYAFWYSS